MTPSSFRYFLLDFSRSYINLESRAAEARALLPRPRYFTIL